MRSRVAAVFSSVFLALGKLSNYKTFFFISGVHDGVCVCVCVNPLYLAIPFLPPFKFNKCYVKTARCAVVSDIPSDSAVGRHLHWTNYALVPYKNGTTTTTRRAVECATFFTAFNDVVAVVTLLRSAKTRHAVTDCIATRDA